MRGLHGTFRVLNSIGGVMSARRPLPGGPDADQRADRRGTGSRYLAQAMGDANVITSDMGGTSFDASIVKDGEVQVTREGEINRHTISLPMIDVHTIGAGGGSIGWLDEGGLLRMGPQSAGADPGPACYGRGGIEPTCTDADLVLGYLDPDYFLGGRMRLDRRPRPDDRGPGGRTARPVGGRGGRGHPPDRGARMANTLREVTIGRGHDPREFVLYAYGGAGPTQRRLRPDLACAGSSSRPPHWCTPPMGRSRPTSSLGGALAEPARGGDHRAPGEDFDAAELVGSR